MAAIEEPAPGYYWVWNREGPFYWSLAQRVEADSKDPNKWRLLDCDGPFPGFEKCYVLGPPIAQLDQSPPDGKLPEEAVTDETTGGYYWAWNRRTGALAPAELIEAYEQEPAEWYVFGSGNAYARFEQDYVLGPAIPEPVQRPAGADLPEPKRKSLRFVQGQDEHAHGRAADQPAQPEIVEDGAASGFWRAVARVLKLNWTLPAPAPDNAAPANTRRPPTTDLP